MVQIIKPKNIKGLSKKTLGAVLPTALTLTKPLKEHETYLRSIYTTGPQIGKWARYQLITSIDWQHIPTRVKVTSDFLTTEKQSHCQNLSQGMSFYSADLLTRPLVADIDRLVGFCQANKYPNVPILAHCKTM